MATHHIAVHGNAALSDGGMPVKIDHRSDGAHITAPAGAALPYKGKVHFLFQNPPMGPSVKFDIVELNATVASALIIFDEVELFSGNSNILTISRGPPGGVDLRNLTALDLTEEPYYMEPRAGICVSYVITFRTATSSANFSAVEVKYKH